MHPQLPGTAESHRFGNPRALPLYPIARTFSSVWSVTTVPTWRRAQVERFASSSAIRMYTSYRGIRSTGGGVAPSARTFRKWVLAGTPSLARLMDLPVGIVVGIETARALMLEPGVEPGRHQPVGSLLAFRGPDREIVGVFVLGVARVPLDPAPRDPMRGGRLHELLPELQVLERSALPLPSSRLPARHPFRHALDQVLRVRDVIDQSVLPLSANPLERGDGAREGHLVVGRLGRVLVEVPPRHAVARGRLDQRGIPAGTRLGAVVSETALVGMDQDMGGGRTGHVRAE